MVQMGRRVPACGGVGARATPEWTEGGGTAPETRLSLGAIAALRHALQFPYCELSAINSEDAGTAPWQSLGIGYHRHC